MLLGNRLTTMQIVSLLPSATEIVYALGLDDQLVGVTFECNEPPRALQEKTVIVGGLDTSAMAPVEIDAYVRTQFAAGADLYTLHQDALAGLDPDLILTQDLCRVCAVPTSEVRAAVAQLGCRADVLTLDPYSLAEVLETISTVARRTGIPGRGDALVNALRSRLQDVRDAVASRDRRRVLVLEWVDPPFGAGHWMPDMVDVAGGEPVACQRRAKSVPTDWDIIRASRPEVVVLAPCGFGLDGAAEQSAAVVEQLPDTEVWAIDGDGLLVRPGPRLVEGVEVLAGILHPVLGPVSDTSASRIR